MAQAVTYGKELKAHQQAEEDEEARLQEESERKAKEDRKKAQEDARKQVQPVKQTMHFVVEREREREKERERDLMKQLEQSYAKEMNGASPSSDFGFWF